MGKRRVLPQNTGRLAYLTFLEKRPQIRGVGTFRCESMSPKKKNASPSTNSRRVEILLEDVIGCRWTIAVLRSVAAGVNRPGMLEREIKGISQKVLADRLRHFTEVGLFRRTIFPEIPPRVEYELTDFGTKFLRLIDEVDRLQAELDGQSSSPAAED